MARSMDFCYISSERCMWIFQRRRPPSVFAASARTAALTARLTHDTLTLIRCRLRRFRANDAASSALADPRSASASVASRRPKNAPWAATSPKRSGSSAYSAYRACPKPPRMPSARAKTARSARFKPPTSAYRRPITALTPTLSTSSHFIAPSAGETTNIVKTTPPNHAPARTTWTVCAIGTSTPPPYYYYISTSMRVRSWTVKGWRRVRLVVEGWSLGREVGEGSGGEVGEDGILTFGPRLVQGAGAAFAAGALLHDAVRDLERPLHGLNGVAQGELFRRSGQTGASPPPLAALHQTGARELRHHAGEQAPRHRRLGRDPVRRHQLAAIRLAR